ncbi:hypothetical protein ACFODL_11265 [Phenylobacterium terrae]|uniref:Uncharacterized protein n=1 Tax=Phenylobacterium terrae TaxID=2665495 RepID=A0ABW4N2P1_9CAUL
MSCEAVAAAALLWLAAGPASVPAAAPPPAVAQEPLFAEIVSRARALKTEVDGYRAAGAAPAPDFAARIGELAALDMKGHIALRDRGIDGDLKCILRGIAEDLPVKLAELEKAADPKARDLALRDMAYLLNDNVEVITAPPQAPV